MRLLLIALACLSMIACQDSQKSRTSEDANQREWIPEPDANPPLSTAEIIAYKNGLDQWKDVTEIAFTFNVDRGERHFERSFIWKPKSEEVTYMNSRDTLTYTIGATLDSMQLAADKAFVNDKYWLLAPYQLVWDEGVSFSEKSAQIAPISGDTLDVLTITYGNEGGYTPGDAYDLYYGKDFMIREWVFREGNDSVPSMTTTWEDYEDYNGLKIAKTHRDSTGNFKLHFTNISVKR